MRVRGGPETRRMEEGKDQMIDVKGKHVFLSGPMTGIDHYNVAAFCEAHARLKEAGAEFVYNPALKYLIKKQRKLAAMGHGDWMADCINELTKREAHDQTWHDVVPLKYDLLASLPRWERSDGATKERTVAEACGIETCELEEVFA